MRALKFITLLGSLVHQLQLGVEGQSALPTTSTSVLTSRFLSNIPTHF